MNDLAAATEKFVEGLGIAAQADGLPRIAGRMMAFFVVEGGPCSFSEISQRLQISRGSVSTNSRLLEGLGVIERVAKPGDRQDYFRLSDDPFRRLLEGYVVRMNRIQTLVLEARRAIPASKRGARERLDDMADFYQAAISNTEKLITRMRSRK